MIPQRVKACDCPICGSTLDGAAAASEGDRGPLPGDLTLCVYCGTLLEFTDAFDLITVSDDFIAKLPAEAQADLAQARSMAAAFRKLRGVQ